MSEIVVIGCGNPLRGDDGVGWYAVDLLEKAFKDSEIKFLKCRELMPELSADLNEAGFVLFIDASVNTQAHTVEETVVTPEGNLSAVETHQLNPAGLLAFTGALYENMPDAIMLTVKGESFEYGERLSDSLVASAVELVDRADDILRSRLQKISPGSSPTLIVKTN